MKINTLVVDDDLHWQTILSKMVQANPLLSLVGVCSSAMDAYAQLVAAEVDLLICDIEMPELSGLDFVRSMQRPPLVIFVTSHHDYALLCYEVSPVDFLSKPPDPARFLKSIEKAWHRLQHAPESVDLEPYFFVRENQRYVQIRCSDVLYMQAQENFLSIVTTTETYMPILSITRMEEQLKNDLFLRVHRSYLVYRAAIGSVGKNELVLRSGQVIPIGEQYRAQLQRKHIDGKVIVR